MALTAEQRAKLEARLEVAEAAYDQLMIGQVARVFVDQNGERVEYVAANAQRLASYILTLKTQLGKRTIAGPMTVWF